MKKLLLPSLLLLLATAGAIDAHQPPRDLHQMEDGHWTAWNPPMSFAEGTEVHIVETGDTLWDLAERLYGNSYLWPQLWERNPYVLDAHWIYAGDPLVTNIQVTPLDQLAAVPDGDGEGDGEGEEGLRLDSRVTPPEPLGSSSDLDCSGYIGALDEVFEHVIVGTEFEALMPNLRPSDQLHGESAYGSLATLKYDLTTGDILYIDSGLSSGLLPGTIYQVVTAQEKINHPVSRKTIGRFYRFSGRLRILTAQEESAIAEIVQTCMPINIGDRLRPYKPEAIPLARRGTMIGVNEVVSDSSFEQAAMIVRSQQNIFSLGQDHVVYVDRGADSVDPGDIFTIYRANKTGLPPVIVGELGVLAAHENSAVAKILGSRYPIYIGDRLIRKNP